MRSAARPAHRASFGHRLEMPVSRSIEAAHHEAAMLRVSTSGAGGELAQRLAHRGARHAEAPRDIGFIERHCGSAPRTISSASCSRSSLRA
jgi:hypothetical protein